MTLRLFAFVHLNLAFSSIEESQRATVLERCYWPLLRLARELDLPLGIEATGFTLECIHAGDPKLLDELRTLVTQGRCEFIGSGYAQIIGPIVPADVNAANLHWGNETYERLLGLRPRLALVNEQAYAAGLVPLYSEAGYDALIMEWNNPASAHPEWPSEWRYFPQRAAGPGGETLPVVWNESVAFQKFQRYAHGEIELGEYLAYLRQHVTLGDRAFSVYGNDVEIFDFRPGRFATEAQMSGPSEWDRIRELFETLLRQPDMRFIATSDVLDLAGHEHAGHVLRLESPAQPVPVKKQGKYNLVRWAVTGRDDLGVNTRCHRILAGLRRDALPITHPDWKELCYLWSSDFRTHITESRWRAFRDRLDALVARRGVTPPSAAPAIIRARSLERHDQRITVGTPNVRATLNARRGLAIESLTFRGTWPEPLCGTVPHGTFDDIRFSADWYTGNLVLEVPAEHKMTDLEQATCIETGEDEDGAVLVRGVIDTKLGPVVKTLRFANEAVELWYQADWPAEPFGSLRLGFVTLLPGAFDEATLWYRTHNGGRAKETFALHGTLVDHGIPVSALVSASHALGVTEGVVEIGDAKKSLVIEPDLSVAAVIGMVGHRMIAGKPFCQVVFSAEELDDTRRPSLMARDPLLVRIRLSARRGA